MISCCSSAMSRACETRPPSQCSCRGQLVLRGQMMRAGRSSASGIQAMFSTLAAPRIAMAASSGTRASPWLARQACAMLSTSRSASGVCARSAGTMSTPTDSTCGLPAMSSVRREWHTYSRNWSPSRSTEICEPRSGPRVRCSMRNTAQCGHGSVTCAMLPQGSGMPLPRYTARR